MPACRGAGSLAARSWLTWGRAVDMRKTIPRCAVLIFRRGKPRPQAAYTPPGGCPPIECTVIVDTRDRELEFGRGAAVMQGQTLQVRRSELPAPVKGGTFAIGSATLSVLDDPRSDDPDRHVWRMTVR